MEIFCIFAWVVPLFDCFFFHFFRGEASARVLETVNGEREFWMAGGAERVGEIVRLVTKLEFSFFGSQLGLATLGVGGFGRPMV